MNRQEIEEVKDLIEKRAREIAKEEIKASTAEPKQKEEKGTESHSGPAKEGGKKR